MEIVEHLRNLMAVETMEQKNSPRVVIVGSGFGGLVAARTLARSPVKITLVDRQNFHTFQPLLYQVATAGLSPGEIAAPIRWILRNRRNVEVLMAEVQDFDLARKVVKLADGELAYDYLIVAAGASHAYFGHDEWEPFAPGLKTIEDALELRRRVLLAFELAERQAASGKEQVQLNFVVVGGGPTGVELAGTLAEIARRALANEFRTIDPRKTRIILLEGGPRVLPAYPEDLSRSAEEQLRKLGVEVHTSALVTNVTPGAVHMGNTQLPAAVTLWAAGVAASPLGKKLGAPVDRAGRVLVNPDLSLPGHPEVFVIGDLAALKDENGKWLPGVAPVAMQEGKATAHNIEAELDGEARKNFHYFNKGNLATIGRAAAVAEFGKIHISGFLAWLAWLFVHVFFLIGFRNRIIVMVQWAWSYFTYERGARLITGDTHLPGWDEMLAEEMGPSEVKTNVKHPPKRSLDGAPCLPRRDAGATLRDNSAGGRLPMKPSKLLPTLCGILLGAVLGPSTPSSAEILKIVVNDTIHPITDEYIGRALSEAERNKDQALLIEMNTPGGLLESTRNIIEKILASPVPVIIYVTPSGSRAASAGFFILQSADVAAMAPGTNTGAAHPVTLGGGKMDDVMKRRWRMTPPL